MPRNVKKSKKSPAEAVPHPTLTLLSRSHTEYPDTPDKARLESFVNAYPARDYEILFDCPEFTPGTTTETTNTGNRSAKSFANLARISSSSPTRRVRVPQ